MRDGIVDPRITRCLNNCNKRGDKGSANMRTVSDTAGTKTTVQPPTATCGLRGSIGDSHADECTVAAHIGPRSIHHGIIYPANTRVTFADSNNNHDHHRNLESQEQSHNPDDAWIKCKFCVF